VTVIEIYRSFYESAALFCLIIFLILPFFHDVTPAEEENAVSPELQVNHPPDRANRRMMLRKGGKGKSSKWRSMDVSGNNRKSQLMGASFNELSRMMDGYYGDGVSELAGETAGPDRLM
jgi:hypothetical protein